MIFCWGIQEKECLGKANIKVFFFETQVKECFDIINTWEDAWWSIHMTAQTVVGEYWALVWFVPHHYTLLKIHMYCFTLNFWAQLVVVILLRIIHSRSVHEAPVASILGHNLRWLASLLVSSELNNSCLVSACWKEWSEFAGLCLVSAFLEDCSGAVESYLVFDKEVNCCQIRLSPPPKTYCWTSPLPPYPSDISLQLFILF